MAGRGARVRTATYRTGSDCKQRGMTLLELLVVLVIASLMLALVAPNIGNVLPGSELKAFARQSAALLREMRSEAVSQSRIISLQADAEKRSFVSEGKIRAKWPDGIDVRLNEKALPNAWRDPFSEQPTLKFYPDGSSSGGELELSLPGQSAALYRVHIDSLIGGVWIDAKG
nr:GspH/FimT family pseudopilin [Marinobacterium ramblicola]